MPEDRLSRPGCDGCRSGSPLDFDFSFAFQPVVDAEERRVVAYEALVRGLQGEGAHEVLQRVTEQNRYQFDQACRVKAIALAAQLGCTARLNINFLPRAVYRPEVCLQTTLAAAREHAFPIDRITFEFTEGERVSDHSHLRDIVNSYRSLGFHTALDDFGAGFSGLSQLAEFQTDYIKIDRQLLQGVEHNSVRQAIVRSVLALCADLGITPVAEGVETAEEYGWLREAGVRRFQGYYFARPAFEQLSEVAAALF